MDHNHQPTRDVENNPVVLDAKIEKLADLGELHAKVQHLIRLEKSVEAKIRDYIEAHGPELLQEFNELVERAFSSLPSAAEHR